MGNLKKSFFVCLLSILGLFVFAQQDRIENADVVILLDTSGGILQYYEDINDRVLTEVTDKFVRKGDTVHVLSFNADARYEMSQKINSEKDLSRVVSRFFLMYQLGKNSDFLTGLDYCKKYTSKLANNKEQILIVISDGIFNPPSWSPYRNYSNEQVKNKIDVIAGNIRKTGWKVYYVKLPFPSDAIITNLEGDTFYSDSDGKLSKNNKSGKRQGNKTSGNKNKNSEDNNSDYDSNNDDENDDDYQNGNNGQTNNENNDQDNSESANQTNNGNGSDSNSSKDSSSQNSSGDNKSDTEDDSYTDVSETFTESSGAAKSDLSKNKDDEFSINEKMKDYAIVTFPENLEAEGKNLNFDLLISNKTDDTVELDLEKIVLDNGLQLDEINVAGNAISLEPGEETTLSATALLPENYDEGNYNVIMGLRFKDNKKVFPQAAELALGVYPTTAESLFSSDNLLYWIIGLILLLLLIFLIIFLIRRSGSGSSSNNVVRSNAGTSDYSEDPKARLTKSDDDDEHAKRLNAFQNQNSTATNTDKGIGAGAGTGASIYATSSMNQMAALSKEDAALHEKILKGAMAQQQPRGTYMSPANHLEKIEIKRHKSGKSEIFVLNQNRNIGKRNIHVMKAGTRLSVGGGKSDDFLIFLVPFPSKLAQVRYDGQDYHLAILKPEYFPYETSNVVNNCIGKTITAVSDKGYHVYFTFRDYEDPATKLNDILTSIHYD